MEPKILKTEDDYHQAAAMLEKIGDHVNFEDDPILVERFDLFAKLIDDYEKEHYKIKAGDPIEIIKLKMGYLNLTQKDLEPFIGSKGTVSDVLNRKRALSKNMIRKLAIGLKIDEAILLTNYELKHQSLDNKFEFSQSKRFVFSKELEGKIGLFSTQVKTRGLLLNVFGG